MGGAHRGQIPPSANSAPTAGPKASETDVFWLGTTLAILTGPMPQRASSLAVGSDTFSVMAIGSLVPSQVITASASSEASPLPSTLIETGSIKEMKSAKEALQDVARNHGASAQFRRLYSQTLLGRQNALALGEDSKR